MAGKGYSLDSIKLDDFPENRGLADSYFDRETGFGAEFFDDDSETVFMPKSRFLEEEEFIMKHSGELMGDYEIPEPDPDDVDAEIVWDKLPESVAAPEEVEEIAVAPVYTTTLEEDMASEGINSYQSQDIDDFLNKLNQKAVSERNEAREASRWKPKDTPARTAEDKPDLDSIKLSEEDIAISEVASVSRIYGHAGPDRSRNPENRRKRPAGQRNTQNQPETRTAKKAGQEGTRQGTDYESRLEKTQRSRSGAKSLRRIQLDEEETRPKRRRREEEDDEYLAEQRFENQKEQRTSLVTAFKGSLSGEKKAGSKSRPASSGNRSSSQSSSGSRQRSSKSKERYVKKTPIGVTIAKIVFILLIWVAVLVAGIKLYNMAYDIFNDIPVDAEDITKTDFTTTGKETDEEMGEKLLKAGFIDDIDLFVKRCKIYDSEYYEGTFKLSRSFNTEKILNILAGYNYSSGTMEEPEPVTEAPEPESTEDDQVNEGGDDAAGSGGDEAGGEDNGEGGGED